MHTTIGLALPDLAQLVGSCTLAHAEGHGGMSDLARSAPIIAGLVAGAAHVVTGPDHMAAVAPLAIEQRRRTWLAGCMWGLGHSSGVWTLAIIAVLLREAFPVDAVSSWSERLVGFVLIAVGLWGIHRVIRLRVHTHAHTHEGPDGSTHTHEHTHAHAAAPGKTHEHRHAPHGHHHGLLGIGALHGLAGTSHLLGVLPALAMPSRGAAIGYVAAFGVGSILGMGVFAGALGMLVRATDRFGRQLTKGLMAVSSVVAIGIGVLWIRQTF